MLLLFEPSSPSRSHGRDRKATTTIDGAIPEAKMTYVSRKYLSPVFYVMVAFVSDQVSYFWYYKKKIYILSLI